MSGGRYVVEPWWDRWAVYDAAWVSPSKRVAGPFNTQTEAQAAADALNNPPAPPTQLALDTTEDVA